MNRTSKFFMLIGIIIQFASILMFFLYVRPITGMALTCLCFILFAELEFFGGMTAIRQGAQEQMSPIMRYGFSIISGVYTAASVLISLNFLMCSGEMLKVFVFIQLLLLAAMLLLNFILMLVVRLCSRFCSRVAKS